MTNKRFQAIIRELFIRCRKPNTSLVFITQSYFSVPKEFRLNSTHYLIMKIHKERTKERYSFLTIDTALPADNLKRFRKNFSDSPL